MYALTWLHSHLCTAPVYWTCMHLNCMAFKCVELNAMHLWPTLYTSSALITTPSSDASTVYCVSATKVDFPGMFWNQRIRGTMLFAMVLEPANSVTMVLAMVLEPRYLRGFRGPGIRVPRYLRGFRGPGIRVPRYLQGFRGIRVPRYL